MTDLGNEIHKLEIVELDIVSGGMPKLAASAGASGPVGTGGNKTLDGGNFGGLFLMTLIGSYLH
jgi:hypothetical protein